MQSVLETNSDGQLTTYADSIFNAEAGLLPPNPENVLGVFETVEAAKASRLAVHQYIDIKLAASGFTPSAPNAFVNVAGPLIDHFVATQRQAGQLLCGADRRLEAFLQGEFGPESGVECGPIPTLPETFTLDKALVGRELSLPANGDHFKSTWCETYRVRQGVLSNPANDKRTTVGVFHIAEGGYPIAADKIHVPKQAFIPMLRAAFNAPANATLLPFTSHLPAEQQAHTWVSSYCRPLVVPGVPGVTPARSMEVRAFAPASLVTNLDFIENVFGCGGDPALPENDAALDPLTWTGTSGYIVLAPHLIGITKKAVNLPHITEATDEQKAAGMCWENEDELYHNGRPFKLVYRAGKVVVTIIADNYFGYCKKGIKEMISFSANVTGQAEEEHAGGALAFSSWSWGEEFFASDSRVPLHKRTFADAKPLLAARTTELPSGALADKIDSNIIYVPEDSYASIRSMKVSFRNPTTGVESFEPLRPERTYILPSGYAIQLQRHSAKGAERAWWHIVGIHQDSMTYVHKPATVSGGGKSEVSKSLMDYIQSGPLFVGDLAAELDTVQALVERDYADRFRTEDLRPEKWPESRAILSPERSLGSVIKLLTPSNVQFTDEYNAWLRTISPITKSIVFLLKAAYKPEWGTTAAEWRRRFSVSIIDGRPGHQLQMNGKPVYLNFLRVGHQADGSWRIFQLRQDFHPCTKLQLEDDITSSVVVPVAALPEVVRHHRIAENADPAAVAAGASVKVCSNAEFALFQRPDDAVHRGVDAKTEEDFSRLDGQTFISNFAPLTIDDAFAMSQDVVAVDKFTAPVRKTLHRLTHATPEDTYYDEAMPSADTRRPDYWVCSAMQRVTNPATGATTTNPRYLQRRPDLEAPKRRYLFEAIARLSTNVPAPHPVVVPVSVTIPGRRCNGPAPGVKPLSCYGPIHYQELPELYAELIPSVTGKSPSTTGSAAIEGPMTKGPFNNLQTSYDLNNSLLSMILTAEPVFTSCAGTIGRSFKVDHDISLLVPEVFARMTAAERQPKYLIENGFLEKIDDFEFEGRNIPASRLGYRITRRFVNHFFGRVFNTPFLVFEPEHLQPEKEDLAVFCEAVDTVTAAQKKVASQLIEDGTVTSAIPPLRALIYCMATGEYEGKPLSHPDIRRLFTREYVLASDWYQARLVERQKQEIAYLEKAIAYLVHAKQHHLAGSIDIDARIARARRALAETRSSAYVKNIRGSLGLAPISH